MSLHTGAGAAPVIEHVHQHQPRGVDQSVPVLLGAYQNNIVTLKLDLQIKDPDSIILNTVQNSTNSNF